MKKRIIFVLAFLLFVLANTYAEFLKQYSTDAGGLGIHSSDIFIENEKAFEKFVKKFKKEFSKDPNFKSVKITNQLSQLENKMFWDAYYDNQNHIIPNKLYSVTIILYYDMYNSLSSNDNSYPCKWIFFYKDSENVYYKVLDIWGYL